MKTKSRRATGLLLLVAVLGFFSGAAAGQDKKDKSKDSRDDVEAIGDRDVGDGMNFYSLEKEIALGKALAQQVEQQSRLVMDPVVAEYVNRLGQNIVRNSDAKVPFTIKVVDSDDVNAFALPGGFFFVNTGLILATEDEAELAGVMAHEIAHVAARHGTKNASKAELANWLTIPLIFLGGPIGYGVRSAASVLIPMKFLQFSRGAEREADYLGLQYLYKTGYDPQAFIDFFEKIQAKEKSRPGTLAKAFSTHPLTPERIDASQEEIRTVLPPRNEYVVTTSEYDRVVERLRVLQNRGAVEAAAEEQGEDRPTLRKTTRTPPASEGQPSEDKGDERPRLERH
ncbi:MAG: peptidase M48 [Acidobacteria bacterium RIFCSPLOWO2_12_FULL_59_11]|nr:MAG: peptidase M48 [Acidobacteria bacterium RIFCSPLOWO2_12_FULL_59_11]